MNFKFDLRSYRTFVKTNIWQFLKKENILVRALIRTRHTNYNFKKRDDISTTCEAEGNSYGL